MGKEIILENQQSVKGFDYKSYCEKLPKIDKLAAGRVLIKPLRELSDAELMLINDDKLFIDKMMDSQFYEIEKISTDLQGLDSSMPFDFEVGDKVMVDSPQMGRNPNATMVTFGNENGELCFLVRGNYIICSVK